mmetsp:Transcript_19788/g.64325  ORF Transcript_19788/g.64325 Transcript_19788/m.64325 type:complete len:354 (-) Transcript_19788:48-1109(-)
MQEDFETLTEENAASLNRLARTASGRAAQLLSTESALRQESTYIHDRLNRLSKMQRQYTSGEESDEKGRTLALARSCFEGAGPGGDLRRYLPPPPYGLFMQLMLGTAANVQSLNQNERLQLREEYYLYRDRTTIQFTVYPALLLWLSAPEKGVPTTLLAFLLSAYFAWLLYFFTALALRENLLRVNGSGVRAWWIKQHYLSMLLNLVMLTTQPGLLEAGRRGSASPLAEFVVRLLGFSVLQGLIMFLQNKYQRKRLYTRIALGKASTMDIVGSQPSSLRGQLTILYPVLFTLQSLQLCIGLSALASSMASADLSKVEWQAVVAGAIFVLLGAGNAFTTVTTFVDKQRAGRKLR